MFPRIMSTPELWCTGKLVYFDMGVLWPPPRSHALEGLHDLIPLEVDATPTEDVGSAILF